MALASVDGHHKIKEHKENEQEKNKIRERSSYGHSYGDAPGSVKGVAHQI